METPRPSPRPYFLPAGVDWDALPEKVKLTFDTLVQPAYTELVLGAATSLERSAGASLVFLLSLEVGEQFELGARLDLSGSTLDQDPLERDKAFRRYLRVFGAKQQAANFLARLERARNRDPLRNSWPPPASNE